MISREKSIFLDRIKGDRPVIFCFHHAGGNARMFDHWINSKMVDAVPVELPGRGIRLKEQLSSDIKSICRETAACISHEIGQGEKFVEFSLFGHSLGAIVAFGVACILRKKYNLHPCCLQISGRHAPQDEDPSPYRTSMGIVPLIEEIKGLGHTPSELLENQEFLDFIMPTIFSDYALSESFVYENQMLDIPIYAYSGSKDRDADVEVMQRWEEVTSKKFRIRQFDGDHFYLFDQKNNVADQVVEDMLRCCKDLKKTDPPHAGRNGM
ncbi:thioesterase II family protein [Pseudoramibacter faecis]|uniref:thioesterase II family protein n=1 Tax=Pseudoramibacter faecis TaxID=3108534 RepID=UPI002E79268E|nr:thioesterase domain-containing protein [Pseudoramibacter sp. HA2172]